MRVYSLSSVYQPPGISVYYGAEVTEITSHKAEACCVGGGDVFEQAGETLSLVSSSKTISADTLRQK